MNRMADINRNQNIVLVIKHGGGGGGVTMSQEISCGVSEYGELESLYSKDCINFNIIVQNVWPLGKVVIIFTI